jgi:transcriptional regulator with XRE-family HTH domain
MRPSPLKHPLAVLRTTIGLTQKEMAEIIGRAARTVQAIELGQLPLSEDLAMLIGQATGVDVGWLLENDATSAIRKGVTALGLGSGNGPYTKVDYEIHRAFVESPAVSKDEAEAFAMKSEQAGRKLLTIPIPIAKAALVEQKKRMLQSIDLQTLDALKYILEKTAGTDAGDLIRWKTRRLLKTLAEEHRIKIDLLAAPDMAIAHIHVTDETEKKAKRSRKQKG